ncbi:hypothetical protein ABZ341_17960 [Streptomyces sp. NPDC006173]|uniref:hypothetical protein n=1 Tax=Streptomyces sp. NPDC006173 TaxID=3155349 RepID=UPI0033FA8CB8
MSTSSSQNPTRDAYIAGLRQFADFLEQHPAVEAPSEQLLLPLLTNDAVEEFAATHELTVATSKDGNKSAELVFGPVVYRAYGYVDFSLHLKQGQEKQARAWADANGMALEPANEVAA